MITWRFLVLILLCAAGCGDPSPPVANPQHARVALETALNAWQKGETTESLKTGSPAIHFNDPDWRSKKKLVKYEIESEHAHGNSWHCDVLLTIQDGAGATQQKVGYIIDTDPTLVVVRD
jgi:hypothetical protein